MSLEGRLERIRQAYQDKGLRLGAAAPLQTVKAFESKYGIRLPEEYRYFVLSLGNGGDGPPFCGMFPLEEADHDDLGKMPEGYAPSQDFPLHEAWIWEGEENPDEPLIEAVLSWGFIYLGTDGCGMQNVLITSGPERGNIWMLSDVGAQPIYFDQMRRYGFLDWLEAWLEERQLFQGE